MEIGEFEIPTLNKHLNKKSPDLSPVKALPVLVPPWAAGAKPIMANFEFKSPNPGTGLPQYISSIFCFLFCTYFLNKFN